MKIQSSTVALASAHSYFEQQTREESFQFWIGDRRPGTEDEGRSGSLSTPASEPRRSAPNKPSANGQPTTANGSKVAATEAEALAQMDPLDRMLKQLVEKLFGVRIQIALMPKSDCKSAWPTTTETSAPTATESEEAPAVGTAGLGAGLPIAGDLHRVRADRFFGQRRRPHRRRTGSQVRAFPGHGADVHRGKPDQH